MYKRLFSSFLGIALVAMLVTTLTLGTARPVQAADIRDTGILEANETIDDDLIISGTQVRVDGTVNGMLLAGGETVTVNGTINGDAVLFGETVIVSESAVINGNIFSGARSITINGTVQGSIAAGAAELETASKVGRNLYFGGYSLQTQPGSDVARGLYFGGYQAMLKGNIARELRVGAGALELDGSVGGDAVLDISSPGERPQVNYQFGWDMPESIPSGLRIGPQAKIGGQLIYTSEANQSSAIQSQPQGGVVYQTPVPDPEAERRATRPVNPNAWDLFGFLRNLFTLLILGLLAVWLLPRIAAGTSEIVRTQFFPSAGYGLAAIIIGYIGAFVVGVLLLGVGLFFTILTLGGLGSAVFGVGFSGLGLLVAAFTLVVSYVSKLVIAYLVGDLILRGASPTMQGRKYLAISLGVLLYAVARSIPYIGWMFGLVVTVAGVGAIWLYWRAWRARRAGPTYQPPADMIPAA